MSSLPRRILLPALILALGCPGAFSAADSDSVGSVAFEASAFNFLAERTVHEPQFLLSPSHRPLLIWREKSPEGSDLYVTSLASKDGLPTVTRLNDEANTVGSAPMDERRAALAVGPRSQVAVAWNDMRRQVRVAESLDDGASFSPSRRLEQVDTSAHRSLPALAYDAAGTLHAVWIDSRLSTKPRTEAADLFYARITPSSIQEHNLTAQQASSVCSCCRPFIESSAPETVRVVFRNTTPDGHRDVFAIEGSLQEGFTTPRRVGPPLWKLDACPVSGPIVAANEVFWPDGSTGRKLLRHASFGGETAPAVFDEELDREWTLRAPPRHVAATKEHLTLLLIPGRPHARLLVLDDRETAWRLASDSLPAWATSALLTNDTLWLVGAVHGEFRFAQRRVEL